MPEKKKRSRLKSLTILTALVILMVVYLQSQSANEHVLMGDKVIQDYQDADSALAEYETARNKFFLLGMTNAYKERVKYAQSLKKSEEVSPSIVIFLKDEASESEISAFIKQLELVSGFSVVKLLSKEDALASYEKRLQGEKSAELFSYISPDDLFLTVEVYLDDGDISQQIVELANAQEFVYRVFEVKS